MEKIKKILKIQKNYMINKSWVSCLGGFVFGIAIFLLFVNLFIGVIHGERTILQIIILGTIDGAISFLGLSFVFLSILEIIKKY